MKAFVRLHGTTDQRVNVTDDGPMEKLKKRQIKRAEVFLSP
jgi:hypothetical protein